MKPLPRLQDISNLSGLTQSEVVPMYAHLIIDSPPDSEIVRINKMIIDHWSNAALILIKDKAWRSVRNVPKYKRLADYLLSTEP
jgi:hypothetical protein